VKNGYETPSAKSGGVCMLSGQRKIKVYRSLNGFILFKNAFKFTFKGYVAFPGNP